MSLCRGFYDDTNQVTLAFRHRVTLKKRYSLLLTQQAGMLIGSHPLCESKV